MNERDINARKRRIETLLHAADDLIEADVAASWLLRGVDWLIEDDVEDDASASGLRDLETNRWFRQVVVTGMVVAYARVFVTGDYTLDREEYKPADPDLVNVHELVLWWRAKVYAHTDKEGGRTAEVWPGNGGAGRAISWQRRDFPVDRLSAAIKLFQAQRERFESEAEELQRELDAELAGPSA
jgi:hypothetical protein